MERSFDTAHFAARVKRRRGPASLRAAAAELGTSASTLDRIERGVAVLDVEFFLRLCAWMEASPQEFYLPQDETEADAVHLVERALRRDSILDAELIESLTTLLALLYKRYSE